MGRYVVMAFATLHKDVLVEAGDMDEARERVERAFADGRLAFTTGDLVADLSDYDVLTPEEAELCDAIREEDCERL